MSTKIVIVESPYAGDIATNIAYARACLRDCLLRGEAPFASHLLYTQPGVLCDEDAEERAMGIARGFEFHGVAAVHAFYVDLGRSRGMERARENAFVSGRDYDVRKLGADWREKHEALVGKWIGWR